MGNPGAKRRRPEEGYRKPAKKIRNFKKQKNYHSSSESDDDEIDNERPYNTFNPVSMEDSDDEQAAAPASASAAKPALKPALKPAPEKPAAPANKKAQKPESESASKSRKAAQEEEEEEEEEEDDEEDGDVVDNDEEEDDDDDMVEDLDDLDEEDDDDEPDLLDGDEFDDSDADDATRSLTKKRKRNDPTAFATSMSKILSSKLSTSKRSDPVLSRSVDAATASKELIDARLEAKARRQLHAEKRQAMEKGRVKDVLGLETTNVSTAHIQEQERRLKKTAQRGVVKLFNAVRAAQVKGEQARAEARKEGVVGMSQREERASEMSKKGFLDLLAQGGKKAPTVGA